MGATTPFFAIQDRLDSVGSTNDYLKQFVDEGQPRAVRARQQTAGRGRNSRVWVSHRDQGLYASFLIYPDWPVQQGEVLNMISVLSVIETIREVDPGLGTDVWAKRPNDVLIRGRKVCGVLVELGSLCERIQWAVLGIGLNLYQTTFPPMARPLHPPTSLKLEGIDVASTGLVFDLLVRQVECRVTTLQTEPERLADLKTRFRRELSESQGPSHFKVAPERPPGP